MLKVNLLLIAMLLVGCVSDANYNKAVDFKDSVWTQSEIQCFDIVPIDTTLSGEILFNLRYLNECQGEKFDLEFTTTNIVTSKYVKDTIKIELEQGIGNYIRSVEVLYRQDVVWQSGEAHRIAIRPLREIEGIVSLNLEIDNAQERTSELQ